MTDFEKWIEYMAMNDKCEFVSNPEYSKMAYIAPQTKLELIEWRLGCDYFYMSPEDRTYEEVVEDEKEQVKQIYSLFRDHMSRFKLKLMIDLLQDELKEWEDSLK